MQKENFKNVIHVTENFHIDPILQDTIEQYMKTPRNSNATVVKSHFQVKGICKFTSKGAIKIIKCTSVTYVRRHSQLQTH